MMIIHVLCLKQFKRDAVIFSPKGPYFENQLCETIEQRDDLILTNTLGNLAGGGGE